MTPDDLLRFPATLTDGAWWVSVLKATFNVLTDWGRYALAHPVETTVCVIAFASIALVARFVLKTMWRVVFYVLVPLAIALWLYAHVLRPLL